MNETRIPDLTQPDRPEARWVSIDCALCGSVTAAEVIMTRQQALFLMSLAEHLRGGGDEAQLRIGAPPPSPPPSTSATNEPPRDGVGG